MLARLRAVPGAIQTELQRSPQTTRRPERLGWAVWSTNSSCVARAPRLSAPPSARFLTRSARSPWQSGFAESNVLIAFHYLAALVCVPRDINGPCACSRARQVVTLHSPHHGWLHAALNAPLSEICELLLLPKAWTVLAGRADANGEILHMDRKLRQDRNFPLFTFLGGRAVPVLAHAALLASEKGALELSVVLYALAGDDKRVLEIVTDWLSRVVPCVASRQGVWSVAR